MNARRHSPVAASLERANKGCRARTFFDDDGSDGKQPHVYPSPGQLSGVPTIGQDPAAASVFAWLVDICGVAPVRAQRGIEVAQANP